MTSTPTADATTVPIAWWRRRGQPPQSTDEPVAMLLWRDNREGTQLVSAYRRESGVWLSCDDTVLHGQAQESFTAAAPARKYAAVTRVPVGDEGPTYEQLRHLLEMSPSSDALLGDPEEVAQEALAAPVTASAPVSEPSAPGPPCEDVALPDGRIYCSRPVAGTTDVQLLRQSRGSLFTRIVGAPGNGKTMLAEAAFGEDLIVVEGHGDLTVDDLVGKWVPRDEAAGYRFAYGPLAEAMLQGKVLLIDDLTRAPSDTVNVLMGPADDRRILVIDALPEAAPLRAADGFHMIVTYNPSGVGVRPLDAAILRRFPLEVEATTDYGLVSELGVDPRLVLAGRLLAGRAVAASSAGRPAVWAPQTDHLLKAQRALDMGLGEQVAASMVLAACPSPQHRQQVREVLTEAFGYEVGALSQRESEQ